MVEHLHYSFGAKAVLALLLLFPSMLFADYEAGRASANQGDFEGAFAEWEPLAQAGDAQAQYAIGRMYARGDGIQQSFELARKWFETAAKLGEPRAFLALGKMYEQGDGVAANPDISRQMYEAANRLEIGSVGRPQDTFNQADVQGEALFAQGPQIDIGSTNKADRENNQLKQQLGQTLSPRSENSMLATSQRQRMPAATERQTSLRNTSLFDNELVAGIGFVVMGIVCILAIVGLLLGLADKAVFYDSAADIAGTFILLALIIGSIVLGSPSNSNQNSPGAFPWISLIVILSAVSIAVAQSIKLNGLGIPAVATAFAKIALCSLIWGAFLGALKKDRSYKDRVSSMFLFGIFSAIATKLINGERVRGLRGNGSGREPGSGPHARQSPNIQSPSPGSNKISRPETSIYEFDEDLCDEGLGWDPYRVLKIKPTSSKDEIEQAYKVLIAKYHPDRYAGLSGAVLKLITRHAQQINRAYTELT